MKETVGFSLFLYLFTTLIITLSFFLILKSYSELENETIFKEFILNCFIYSAPLGFDSLYNFIIYKDFAQVKDKQIQKVADRYTNLKTILDLFGALVGLILVLSCIINLKTIYYSTFFRFLMEVFMGYFPIQSFAYLAFSIVLVYRLNRKERK